MAWLFTVELYDSEVGDGPPFIGPESFRVLHDAQQRAVMLRRDNRGRTGLRVKVTERDEWGRTVQVVSDDPVLAP